MKLLTDFIFIKNLIPANVCEEIKNKIKNKDWIKHQWGYDNITYSEKEKELDVLSSDESINNIITPYIKQAFTLYQNKFSQENNKKTQNFLIGFSEIRFNRYCEGTVMRKHFDLIRGLFDGKIKGVPLISLVGILNDDYIGGEFIFNDDYNVKLKKGDILMFPSNFMYAHEVKEVKKGIRYSFVSWAF